MFYIHYLHCTSNYVCSVVSAKIIVSPWCNKVYNFKFKSNSQSEKMSLTEVVMVLTHFAHFYFVNNNFRKNVINLIKPCGRTIVLTTQHTKFRLLVDFYYYHSFNEKKKSCFFLNTIYNIRNSSGFWKIMDESWISFILNAW